jgi:hypothetical protein
VFVVGLHDGRYKSVGRTTYKRFKALFIFRSFYCWIKCKLLTLLKQYRIVKNTRLAYSDLNFLSLYLRKYKFYSTFDYWDRVRKMRIYNDKQFDKSKEKIDFKQSSLL